ncbi:MAG: AAA family ATPase [Chlorobi bacterium]|nr:AAA family ATPase [Chlorobiota bacterium]
MRLLSFRIQNFRSIVDTGWNQLSSDNITGIIGQNESGKTSILEALKSFYDGKISEDILRSDLSMPVVTCCFATGADQISDILRDKLLPAGVMQHIKKEKKIILQRAWNDDLSSIMLFNGTEVEKLFTDFEVSRALKEHKIAEKLDKLLEKKEKARKEYQKADDEMHQAEMMMEEAKALISERTRTFRSVKKTDQKKMAEKQLAIAKKKYEQAREQFLQKQKLSKEKNKIFAEVNDEARFAEQSKQAALEMEEAGEKLRESTERLRKLQQLYDHAYSDKERHGISLEMDSANEKYLKTVQIYQQARERAIIKKYLAYKILGGLSPGAAEKEIEREKPQFNPYYSREEAGNILAGHIPVFTMFEDFSSLLPNRIDLVDILDGNQKTEGFAAAMNFLHVSGLNAEFFRESNSRILKQKIERLNRELTIDFQDFWRQRIGKTSKITLNFELEHYDHTHPEKSGFPYLEFWVKDRNERLYPKQRSRGVRWFLSFYLELKAAMVANQNKGRVLLIDEPGLSLHARAQEDVLKVFEHIREKIQVIYTTHSPHLIDIRKLYRLLAVQRAVDDDENSETVVFDAKSLTSATTDTLSPIYTLMGSRLSEQQFIQKKNNIILEDLSAYYYLSTFHQLLGYPEEAYFLPATDVSNVQTLVNLLMGWGLDYIVVLKGDSSGKRIFGKLKNSIFGNDDTLASGKLILLKGYRGMEDLFSTLDFKKHVLHERIGIPERNSEFVKENHLSGTLLASSFMKHAQGLKITDFDEETRENIERLFQAITDRLKVQK